MALASADEFQHPPGPDPRWQESYWFSAADHRNHCGVDAHLAHLPHEGCTEAQITVITPEGIVSLGARYAVDDPLAVPGLDADVRVPFEHWTLRYEGHGVDGPDSNGLYAQTPGEVPFGFSLDIHQPLPPADFQSAYTDTISPGVAHHHYAGAAVFTGELHCAGQRTPLSGLLVRDHTWGPRDWTFDLMQGSLLALDQAQVFMAAASFLSAGHWSGVCVVHDKDGTHRLPAPWTRPGGLPVRDTWHSAEILVPGEWEPIAFTGQHTIPKWVPSYSSKPSSYLQHELFAEAHRGKMTGHGPFYQVFPADSPLAANLPSRSGQTAKLPLS
ncbi:DUF7065 domain-containing protein [Streptomyces syringium]|uniref:DUF7065 domain-containing protein n=1 Tax=Streptomyces syringium TaxID=76729 RepID=UPI0034560C1B